MAKAMRLIKQRQEINLIKIKTENEVERKTRWKLVVPPGLSSGHERKVVAGWMLSFNWSCVREPNAKSRAAPSIQRAFPWAWPLSVPKQYPFRGCRGHAASAFPWGCWSWRMPRAPPHAQAFRKLIMVRWHPCSSPQSAPLSLNVLRELLGGLAPLPQFLHCRGADRYRPRRYAQGAPSRTRTG